MINTIIIEIVDIVFVILFDNSSSPPFSLGVFDKRDVGEILVVVTFDVATIVVVATVGNGAIDVVLAIGTDAADVVAVDTDAVVVVAAFVVVVADGASVVVVGAFVVVVTGGAFVVVVGASVVVVAFNKQMRLVVRLPLNEMYSLLLHCFQFVQLVPLN